MVLSLVSCFLFELSVCAFSFGFLHKATAKLQLQTVVSRTGGARFLF